MRAERGPASFLKAALVLYLVIFFGYLLGPLLIMAVTAFNSPSFPRAAPFECFTFEWFDTLYNDQRIVSSIKNSAIVGAGTVILSLLLGLAGALVLTQIWPRLRATYYTVVIAPILIPGVVLGISTLVFWGRLNTMLGLPDDGFLRNGIFLTVLGQTTFISSYCMLVFIARLQRFDQGQMEAALDLGATHAQAFRKILLPFLKPAFGSAAVIAFLASFENYNTTTFTFGTYPTLTIELAQKVRYGINPSISALAVIIVGITIVGALLHEAYKRRETMAIANGAPLGSVSSSLKLPSFLSNKSSGDCVGAGRHQLPRHALVLPGPRSIGLQARSPGNQTSGGGSTTPGTLETPRRTAPPAADARTGHLHTQSPSPARTLNTRSHQSRPGHIRRRLQPRQPRVVDGRHRKLA